MNTFWVPSVSKNTHSRHWIHVYVYVYVTTWYKPKVMYPMLSPTVASVSFSSRGGSLWLNSTWGAVWLALLPSLNSWTQRNSSNATVTNTAAVLVGGCTADIITCRWFCENSQITLEVPFICKGFNSLDYPKHRHYYMVIHCKFSIYSSGQKRCPEGIFVFMTLQVRLNIQKYFIF